MNADGSEAGRCVLQGAACRERAQVPSAEVRSVLRRVACVTVTRERVLSVVHAVVCREIVQR